MADIKLNVNTVQELLDQLNNVEDKSLPVFIYDNGEILNISLVDTDISNRVDINIDRPMNEKRFGRKVSKMIFLEREEIGAETFEFLERNNIIERVDYGNTELTSDMFKQMVEDFDNYNKTMSDGREITLKQVREELGLDVADGLITGQLDFIQIIY